MLFCAKIIENFNFLFNFWYFCSKTFKKLIFYTIFCFSFPSYALRNNISALFLRWIHPNENHHFREHFKKQLFSQVHIMTNLYYTTLIEESEYYILFILIKNWLSVCYIHSSETLHLWKIYENFSVTLSLFSPLNLSYSSRFFCSFSLFPSFTVRGLCFHVKMHKMNNKSFKTKLNEPLAVL